MQRGIVPVFFLVVVIVVIVIGAIIFSSKSQTVQNNAQSLTAFNTNDNCATPIKFTHHITDLTTIDSIIPPVFRNSRGTMPTTLINITGKVPLYMPTSGKLTQGSYHNEQGAQFYMWEVDIGCGTTIVFDHVTEPVEKIRKLFPNTPRDDSRTDSFGIPLKMDAGELVGYTTGSVNAHNWNFAVYDSSERNYLWARQEFKNMPKYYTQVCPFMLYDNQMAKAYKEKFILSFNDITVEQSLCED